MGGRQEIMDEPKPIKIRENCLICGKPLTEKDGLFLCNECRNKDIKDIEMDRAVEELDKWKK
jgi:uncharacterized Zn finger protein (UPF0148 family)